MKLPWRLILCGVVILAGLLGTLKMHHVNAQTTGANAAAQKPLYARLAWKRAAATDLEISGDLIGTPVHSDTLCHSRTTACVAANQFHGYERRQFRGPTEISGVALDEMLKALTEKPESEVAIAVCIDKYETHYPRSYI